MNIIDKLLLRKKPNFKSGSMEIVLNTNKDFLHEIETSISKKQLGNFKHLLNQGHKKDILFETYGNQINPMFDFIFEYISELFFKLHYDDAIKFYEAYMKFLIKTNNKPVLTSLKFLTFGDGNNIFDEKNKQQQQDYVKLFDNYLFTKNVFGAWHDVENQIPLLFNQLSIDEETYSIMTIAYRNNIKLNKEIKLFELKNSR